MKELSIEEKAKAYDGLIERLKDLKFACRFSPLSDTIEEMFPELKGSKNERIIRCIGMCLTDANEQRFIDYSISLKDCLDWLEKQGKNNMGISEATKQELEDNLNKALQKETPESWNEFLDEQSEQKPAEEYNITGIGSKNAQGKLGEMIKNLKPINEVLEQKPDDKVEPKFNEGDWTVSNLDGKTRQISEVHFDEYNSYYVVDGKSVNLEEYDRLHHPWIIQDAKDGDVLATENFIFVFKNIDDGNGVHYYCHYEISKHEDDNQFGVALPQSLMGRVGNSISHYFPATKEQCDTLIKAMADAGYELDAEKKELKKAEQKQVITYPDNLPKDNWELIHEFVNKFGRIPKDEDELNVLVEYILNKQKPAWSEEDKKVINLLLELVYEQDKMSPRIPSNEKRKMMLSWLKDLRPQKHWKPSDEQMDALHYVTNFDYGGHKATLVSLYEQLKKLKGIKL